MNKYIKNNPRITVKYINGDTDETLIEINDRSWMNVGEVLTEYYVNELMKQLGEDTPQNLLVIAATEFSKK